MTPEGRFHKLLVYAWNHSPFYRQLYVEKGLRLEDLSQVELADLPVETKQQLVDNFDQIVTDQRLRRADLEDWSSRDPRSYSLYLDELIIISSSAGTDQFNLVPYALSEWRYMTATAASYLFDKNSFNHLKNERPIRSAFFYRPESHSGSVTNVSMASQAAHEVLRLSVLDPIEEIWARLNAFQPERIYSYPSSLEWLVAWTFQGKLHISPQSVVLSGERVKDYLRTKIQEGWGADIYDLYSACESLYIAICQPGSDHFQVFDELNLVEIVDERLRMTTPGQRGRVLLTNLFQKTLPLIRYDMQDYAILGVGVVTAQTITRLDGKVYQSLPIVMKDGRQDRLEVYELALLELPSVQRIQLFSPSPFEIEITYQAPIPLDEELIQALLQLLEQKDAAPYTIRARRQPFLGNNSKTYKFEPVPRSTNPILALNSLGEIKDHGQRAGLIEIEKTATRFEVDPAETVTQRFLQIVQAHPERCAASDDERQYTYHELGRLANQAAQRLLASNFNPRRAVGVLCGQEIEFAPMVLGVLLAGGYYLPLDTNLPVRRLQHYLKEAGTEIVITSENRRELANQLGGVQVIGFTGESTKAESELPLPVVKADDPACLLFTSGSTGTPKGVVLSHGTIVQRAKRYIEDFGISGQDCLSLLQSYAVSAGVREIFGAWLSGASLAIYDVQNQGLAPLAEWLQRKKVTIFYAVPSLFGLFLETLSNQVFEGVRIVRLGGEAPEPRLFEGFLAYFLPGCWLVNAYAATETDTICQVFMGRETKIAADRIPAGYAAPSVTVSLRNASGEVAENWLGEVAVDSALLASGYWDATNMRVAPFTRPFTTGDLGYQLEDGRIFLVGRKDLIVNIHGYRVHLAEIEEAIRAGRGVAEVAAVVQHSANGEKRVAVFYSPENGVQVSVAELRQIASQRLPGAAAPATYIALPAIPRLPGGKINRSLLTMRLENSKEQPFDQPAYQTAIEERLAKIWAHTLGIPVIQREANIFDLGADSLNLLRIQNRIVKEFGVELSVSQLFDFPSLAQMAESIDLMIGEWEEI
jgi:acyl-coenzyme A synthetase/AMP-(fatty) acid ligase/acyl carrier protein